MTRTAPHSAAAATSFRREWLSPFLFSLLLSLLLVTPFFLFGTASGHDFEFHAPSWLDAAYQWKQGILYPRWTAWTNHGFGEPRFIFYPPLSWMLGAALSLVVPDAAIPVTFIVLVQTFAGLAAYALLRRLVCRRAALLGASFYVVNPNALLLSYIRSDFAEQLACAFLPLLFLMTLRLCELFDDPEPRGPALPLFSLVFAALWLCNAPAAVIATYSASFLMAWTVISRRSPRIAGRCFAALLLGFGLAAFYIVPAAYEQRWVNIGQALSSGLLPVQNFLFTSIDDVEHTWFNWIASICTLSLILLAAVAALASRRFSRPGQENRRVALALLALAAVATFLTVRWSAPLWELLPKLRFVQFPWRWISALAVLACCFLGFVLEKRRGWMWFAALLFLSLPLAYFLGINTWWDEDEMSIQRDALVSEHGFDGTDEYDPLGDDHSALPADAPLVKVLPVDSGEKAAQKAAIEIETWTTESKRIRVNTPTSARVALRLLNYPAFDVNVNGRAIRPERMDDFNQMVVPIAPGASEIHVQFTRTADRKIGNAASLLSGGIFVLLLWRRRRRD